MSAAPTVTESFIVTTGLGHFREVDAAITGDQARKWAIAHRKELIREGFATAREVQIIELTGPNHSEACDALTDHIDEGKPVGRKAFAVFAEQYGCHVGLARA